MLSKPLRGRRVNQRHWSANGLVGAWLFNEGCGTKAFDSSGHGNHGTLIDMASPPTAASGWGAGRRGTALRFDGSNDLLNCGNDSSLDITDAITIEAWVKPYEEYSGAATGTIISKDDAWTGVYSIILSWDRCYVHVRVGGVDKYSDITPLPDINKWTNIVLTYDGANLIQYQNGLAGTPVEATGAIGISEIVLTIGAATDDHYFNGSIDGVKIYDRALSGEEIGSLYRDEYAMFNPLFSPGIFYIPITARSYGYIF